MSQQSRLSNYYSSHSSSSSGADTSSSTPSTSTSSSSKVSISTSRASSSTSSTLPESPVNPIDPADLSGHLLSLSRDYKRQLVQLGPCQPRLSSYPWQFINITMARKGHFRQSGLIYRPAKNGWNIHATTTECTVCLQNVWCTVW